MAVTRSQAKAPAFRAPVWLWVPNLVGYLRVIFALYAFHVCYSNYVLATVLYTMGFVFDWLDGQCARWFNQSSRFGAVLDMVTDRSCTAAFLIILTQFYKEYTVVFCFLVMLDISSHYFHMVAAYIKGQTSHKSTEKDQNPLLALYYSNKLVMCTLCTGAEVLYIALYVIHFNHGHAYFTYAGYGLFQLIAIAMAPLCFIKQVMNVLQLCEAALVTIAAEFDPKTRHQ